MPDNHFSGFGGAMDQAEGLRRLLGHAPLRVTVFAGPGATTVTVNLAAALGAGGMDVLVVDENASHGNVADQLGLGTRYDLVHALHGDCTLQDAICEAAAGVNVLPAARGTRELKRAVHPASLNERMREAGHNPDMVLVDSAAGCVSQLLRGTAACTATIVTGPRHSEITAAYSLIKNAARAAGDSRFQIIVNRASDAGEAAAIFRNMAAVAASHIGVELEMLGWLPNHPQFKLARAARRSVIDAFPAGNAAAAVRELALRLRERVAHSAQHFARRAANTHSGPEGIPAAAIRGGAGWPATAAAYS